VFGQAGLYLDKQHLLANELLDDGDLLKQVLVATAMALPAAKPKS
jgi:hypothetical protein